MSYHIPHWKGDKPLCKSHGHAWKLCFTNGRLHVCGRCGRLGLDKAATRKGG